MRKISRGLYFLLIALATIAVLFVAILPSQGFLSTTKVAAPVFNPPSGTYTGTQNISLSCETPGATIRISTSGSVPNKSSAIYTHPLTLSANATITARAFEAGMSESDAVSATYTIITPSTVNARVATPVFNPVGGVYSAAQVVSISCATSGAAIRFTTNGLEPTSSSNIYTGQITVSANATLRARAFKSGMDESQVATATYTIVASSGGSGGKVATPVFNPSGGVFSGPQSVSVSCATSGATIRISTSSAVSSTYGTSYTSPLTVSSNYTLYARAYKSGMNESDAASVTFTIILSTNTSGRVAKPVFSPSGGTYSGTQTVYVSCATSGATIRISSSSAVLNASSTAYSGPLTISGNVTIYAKAFLSGMSESEVATATYTIITTVSGKVATPTFSPTGGIYTSTQNVVISCATSGATIRYTTNGAEPTSASTAYTGQIAITGNTTLKAKAFKSGMSDSEIATATYTISLNKVDTPTFSLPSGNYSGTQTLTLSCTTIGATICYTTDGSIPTTSSPIYTGSITINGNMTVIAKAFKTGMYESSASYAVYKVI